MSSWQETTLLERTDKLVLSSLCRGTCRLLEEIIGDSASNTSFTMPDSKMLDFTLNLNSLSFESGLSEREKRMLPLRARSASLAVCGCAHAAYLCKLAQSLRESALKDGFHSTAQATVSRCVRNDQRLTVGILGGGHIGKQLTQVLIEKTDLKPPNINISTRRPETLEEFVKKGVDCYYDNRKLVVWADVLFLCCLPSHLPQVCAEINSHLPRHCLVYSFVSAVPLNRLSQLLAHTFIVKPHYEFVESQSDSMWLSHSHVNMALEDPEVITASCPFGMTGGLSLDQKWIFGMLYGLLNMCTSLNLGSRQAAVLINKLFRLESLSQMEFTAQSWVNRSFASSLGADEPFPWINLIDAQSKETPLSRFLNGSTTLQNHLSEAYRLSLATQLT